MSNTVLSSYFKSGRDQSRQGLEVLKTRIATIRIRRCDAGMAATREGFLRAWESGIYQGEHFDFESPAVLFRTITPLRWKVLGRLQQTGPLTIRTLARELERDIRRAHDDVRLLRDIGLIENTGAGKVWVPFKQIHTSFVLRHPCVFTERPFRQRCVMKQPKIPAFEHPPEVSAERSRIASGSTGPFRSRFQTISSPSSAEQSTYLAVQLPGAISWYSNRGRGTLYRPSS